jgi:transposase-like protein
MESKLAIGDGALGFWKALAKVYGNTRQQRCWVHKTDNVLNCLPKVVQPRAKQALHQIWIRLALLRIERSSDFFDFPAEHWPHLRTTNPIESTVATVKLRTAKTRSCLSRQTMLTMVFKLCRKAVKRRRRLQGYRQLGEVIENVKFINGVREDEVAA